MEVTLLLTMPSNMAESSSPGITSGVGTEVRSGRGEKSSMWREALVRSVLASVTEGLSLPVPATPSDMLIATVSSVTKHCCKYKKLSTCLGENYNGAA